MSVGEPRTSTGDAMRPDSPRLIVVLDTDPGVRWALEKGLARSGYLVRAVSNAGELLRIAYEEPVDGVVMELLAEAGLGDDVLRSLLEVPEPPRVICVSVDSDPQTVIDCIRRGAADFLPKPFSLAEVRSALSRALASEQEQRIIRRPDRARPGDAVSSLLIGISPAMQELRTTIQQVSQTDLNCLIRGESGTGKDMVAREIHRQSARSEKPFVKVNCTALPEQLLESELFGYEKGAFTGAVSSKPGRFELANRGVIFLDEIGDMQPSLQSKLLQVIEHKEFTKLGGRRHIQVDVQIIAATNADLEQRTKEGAFRDDLYFRLNEVCIWVPPLNDRKEDIPLLVRHFIQKHGRFAGGASFEISGEDLASLTEHDWPGHVRELESTIKRWLALGQKVLPVSHGARFPSAQSRMERPVAAPTAGMSASNPGPATGFPGAPRRAGDGPTVAAADPATNDAEAQAILATLERVNWNRRKAADALGISYQTLRRRIQKYGLNRTR